MVDTFTKFYKKIANSGNDSDYELVGEIGVDGVPLKNYITSQMESILDSFYPVGSIYFSVKNTNPSKYFGGKWVSWGSGRVPVGVSSSDSNFNTVEKTGGESRHTLTVSEIPSHNHNLNIYTEMASDAPLKYIPTTGNCKTQSKTTSTGGGQSHNNLQPYITCYMWKRTA